jgi:diguanylate cyclase (GGDEF)-like protein
MFPNKQVEKYYHLCERILNFSHLSWWIIDLEDDPNTFYCNQTMCETFSLDQNVTQHSVQETCPIAGDYNTNIAIRNSEKAQHIFNEYHQLRNGTINEYSNRFPYYDSNSDETKYFSSRAIALLKDKFNNPTLLVGIIEREKISAELYKKVTTDGLTGLKNRREFDSQIYFLINLAKREKRLLSLIMCDVDHFKQYNDMLGHYAGDECLIKIARSISNACVRSSDIVCRYGGEEFSVIVYGDDNNVSFLAEAIRKDVYTMDIPHPAQNNSPVTISAGYYSISPDSESSPKKLIECADMALYEAKRKGRNICVQFTEQIKANK